MTVCAIYQCLREKERFSLVACFHFFLQKVWEIQKTFLIEQIYQVGPTYMHHPVLEVLSHHLGFPRVIRTTRISHGKYKFPMANLFVLTFNILIWNQYYQTGNFLFLLKVFSCCKASANMHKILGPYTYTGCPVTILRSLNCKDGDIHAMWFALLKTPTEHLVYDPPTPKACALISFWLRSRWSVTVFIPFSTLNIYFGMWIREKVCM